MRSAVSGTVTLLCLLLTSGNAQTQTARPMDPGKTWPWVYNHIPMTVAAHHATPAELKAVESNLIKIADLFKATPMMNPILGFDMRYTGTLLDPNPDIPKSVAAMPYNLEVAFLDFLLDQSGRPTGKTFPNHGLEVYINDPYRLMGSTGNTLDFQQRWWTDKEGQFWIDPPSDLFKGLRFYRIHDAIAITRDGAPLLRPVPVSRFLPFYVTAKKKAADSAEDRLASAKRAYDGVTSPEAEARHQKELDAARTSKNGDAEVRRLEKIRQRKIDDARAEMTLNPSNPKHQWYFAAKQAAVDAEALAASLTGDSRKAPACITGNTLHAQESEYRLVPDGTAGCRRIVEPDLSLFSNTRPRTAIQMIVVKGLESCERMLKDGSADDKAFPGGCPGTVKLADQLDWEKLSGLISR
ncbi:MAG: hypothetical protein WCP29_06430 [Acidobacteriota bacterium]